MANDSFWANVSLGAGPEHDLSGLMAAPAVTDIDLILAQTLNLLDELDIPVGASGLRMDAEPRQHLLKHSRQLSGTAIFGYYHQPLLSQTGGANQPPIDLTDDLGSPSAFFNQTERAQLQPPPPLATIKGLPEELQPEEPARPKKNSDDFHITGNLPRAYKFPMSPQPAPPPVNNYLVQYLNKLLQFHKHQQLPEQPPRLLPLRSPQHLDPRYALVLPDRLLVGYPSPLPVAPAGLAPMPVRGIPATTALQPPPTPTHTQSSGLHTILPDVFAQRYSHYNTSPVHQQRPVFDPYHQLTGEVELQTAYAGPDPFLPTPLPNLVQQGFGYQLLQLLPVHANTLPQLQQPLFPYLPTNPQYALYLSLPAELSSLPQSYMPCPQTPTRTTPRKGLGISKPQLQWGEVVVNDHTPNTLDRIRKTPSPLRKRDPVLTLEQGEIDRYILGPDKNRLYHCTFEGCDKSGTRRYNIRLHVQTHLLDRPYECVKCDKTFVRQHDLVRHEKIHEEGEFGCECGKRFTRNDALRRHRQRNVCVGGVPDPSGVVKPKKRRGRPRKNDRDSPALEEEMWLENMLEA